MPDFLPVVSAAQLPKEWKSLLAPGERVKDWRGVERVRPDYFYEIDSWDRARSCELAPYMSLWEFISVDVKEDAHARTFPRYVPCAVSVLAAHLSALRQHFGTYLHISANGGFRTPAHQRGESASTHCWATAADIYRIGDDFLEDEETIESYRTRINKVMPGVNLKPYGHRRGETDDHLHLDVGYLVTSP